MGKQARNYVSRRIPDTNKIDVKSVSGGSVLRAPHVDHCVDISDTSEDRSDNHVAKGKKTSLKPCEKDKDKKQKKCEKLSDMKMKKKLVRDPVTGRWSRKTTQ